MKAVNIQRLSLILALMLGIMAFWSAAAPSAMGADSSIGGWYPYSGCPPCTSTSSSICPHGRAYPGGRFLLCEGGSLVICMFGTSTKNCEIYGSPACHRGQHGDPICDNIYDSSCY